MNASLKPSPNPLLNNFSRACTYTALTKKIAVQHKTTNALIYWW